MIVVADTAPLNYLIQIDCAAYSLNFMGTLLYLAA
jgi:hypothetical protein